MTITSKTEKCPAEVVHIFLSKKRENKGTVTMQHFDFAQTRTQKRGNANTNTHPM